MARLGRTNLYQISRAKTSEMGTWLLNGKSTSKGANQLRLAPLALLKFCQVRGDLPAPNRHAICQDHGGTLRANPVSGRKPGSEKTLETQRYTSAKQNRPGRSRQHFRRRTPDRPN